MNKCVDHPRMVFKGTLYHEGHSVTFNILDDCVEVTESNVTIIGRGANEEISVKRMDTDDAIKKQKQLLNWRYQWI